jgi:hypothetical protein
LTIFRRSLSTAKVLIESNTTAFAFGPFAYNQTIPTNGRAYCEPDKVMETCWYSLYFPINCYYSTQRVGVRVGRAE